jgi:opacity protein-like surface antigen
MKKNFLIVFMIFSVIGLSEAQLYTGLNAKMAIPVQHEENVSRYGGGGGILIGYSFHPNADIQMGVNNSWFNSIAEGYQIRSALANVRYYLFRSFVNPYVGIGGGYFHSRIETPLTPLTENAPGIIPALGILFNTHIHENLFVDTEISYNKIFFDKEIDLLQLNIGIRYVF